MYTFNVFNNHVYCLLYIHTHIHTICIHFIYCIIYKGDLNLKWQSVLLDATSVEIQSLIQALGIVFCKITEPLFVRL